MVKHNVENLGIARKLEPFYDKSFFGAQLTADGSHLFCRNGAFVNIIGVDTGSVLRKIGVEEDEINSFIVVDANEDSLDEGQLNARVITAHRSLLLREWNAADGKLLRTWNSQHRLPILRIVMDKTRTLIATASTDSTAKCFDIVRQYLTHNCRPHSGSVRLIAFTPDSQTLFTVDDTSTLRAFDLASRAVRWSFETAHVSPITAIEFSADARHFITAGRDRVITVWRFVPDGEGDAWIQKVRTVPVFESIESAFFVQPQEIDYLLNSAQQQSAKQSGALFCITAGETGALKLFDLSAMRVVCVWNAAATESQKKDSETREKSDYYSIHSVSFMQRSDSYVLVARANGTLELRERHDANNRFVFRAIRQFSGCTHEEVLDLAFPNDRLLAIASDSDELRVVDIRSNDSRVVRAHTDAILALATTRIDSTRSLIATASRDSTAKIWLVDDNSATDASGFDVKLIASASGHTDHVTAVAFSQSQLELETAGDETFLVSGASDCFIKIWKLAEFLKSLSSEGASSQSKRRRRQSDAEKDKEVSDAGNELTKLESRLTVRAHEKRINSVAVSPNAALLATACQDRLVKIFETRTLTCVGSLPHRKSVASVRFSRDEAVIVTACADKVVRLFEARAPFACRCTLEGHNSGVLQAVFVNHSRQIISTGCDGLLKLWNVSDRECVRTFDDHAGRVWALAVREPIDGSKAAGKLQQDTVDASALLTGGGLLVASGDSESSVIIWADVTTQEQEVERVRQTERVVQDQTLRNLLFERRHVEAVRLCLKLERKLELFNIFTELLSDADQPAAILETCLHDVRDTELARLLNFIADWNTQTRSCVVAQKVANALLRSRHIDELLAIDKIERFVEAFVPYSDRHLSRLDRLQSSVSFLDFAAYSMRVAPSQQQSTQVDTEMNSPAKAKQSRIDSSALDEIQVSSK